MGLMDDVKNAVGGAFSGAAKDDNVKNQVKSAASDAAVKLTGDKVDKKVVSDTVNTVVDQAANFVNSKQDEKNN